MTREQWSSVSMALAGMAFGLGLMVLVAGYPLVHDLVLIGVQLVLFAVIGVGRIIVRRRERAR